MRSNKPRAFAIPFVLAVLVVLALGTATLSYVLLAGIAEKQRALGQVRVFYAIDALLRVTSSVAQAATLSAGTTHADTLTQNTANSLCSLAGRCEGTRLDSSAEKRPTGLATEPGYPYVAEYRATEPGSSVGPAALLPPGADLEHFLLMLSPNQTTGLLESGPLNGLLGTKSNIYIEAQAIDQASGAVARGKDRQTLSALAPFELMVFSTVPSTTWSATAIRDPVQSLPAMFAFGATGTTTTGFGSNSVERLFARIGPSILNNGPVTLTNESAGSLALTRVVSSGSTASVSFSGGSADAWNGSVAPYVFDVTTVDSRNVWTSATTIQLGAQPAAKQGQPTAENTVSARWLLDPVLTADPDAAARLKLAYQADIRIIDGVWFIKPPSSDLTTPAWPGIPVWSDHTGDAITPPTAEMRALVGSTTRVGRDDIRIARAWASVPQRFSYYETDSGGVDITATHRDGTVNTGIVSYGLLHPAPTTNRLVPAGPFGGTTPCGALFAGTFRSAVPWSPLYYPGSIRAECLTTRRTALLMDATRYGFRDLNAATAQQNTLPINIDVQALLDALADGSPGELGSYFCGATTPARLDDSANAPPAGCRPFNGIIYVTNTWTGSLNGLINTSAVAVAPTQGANMTAAAAGGPFAALTTAHGGGDRTAAGTEMLTWPPHQLCAKAALDGRTITDAGTAGMRAVGCGTTAFNNVHGSTGAQPNVNAVRIVNARDLSRIINAVVPSRYTSGGLTIASNLPVYVNSDFNVVLSGPSGTTCTGSTPGSTCTYPVTLVAGDRVTFLSNPTTANRTAAASSRTGFQDYLYPWDSVVYGASALPAAYVTSVMSTLSSGTPENIEHAFRVMENWNTKQMFVQGSLFLTGRSVYRADRQTDTGAVRVPGPLFYWWFNPATAETTQPPGTPKFVVGISGRWREIRDGN